MRGFRLGAMLAIFIGIGIAAADVFAHDQYGNPDPPPKTCIAKCKKVQCECVEACKAEGHDEVMNPMGPRTCKQDCYYERLGCDAVCSIPRLSFTLAAAPACYGDGHNAHRSQRAKRIFMRAHPCPGGPDKGSMERCAGHIIDHVCPLQCCGADAPWNMQWQTIAAAHAKDRWEGNCARSCR